ncbi:MAG: hypothetical protein NC102_10755 [Clostridium sp.]|nr:hypothetical protein [Clostridium sp.]
MKRKLISTIFLAAFCALSAQNRYATERLRGIADALGMSQRIESLDDGDYREGLAYKSFPIHVIVEDGEVRHIGWSLPPTHESSPIFLFAERASLEKDLYKADALPPEWDTPDQAFFAEGAIENVLKADRTNIAYTCSNAQGRQYQTKWSTPAGKALCSLAFPISYELISGATLRESEQALRSRLQALQPSDEALIGFGSPSEREETEAYTAVSGPDRPGSVLKNVVYLRPAPTAGESGYEEAYADGDEEPNVDGGADEAYAENAEDQGDLTIGELIFDPMLPAESLANALSSTTASRGIAANVKMMMYGASGRSVKFSLPLSSLVGYFLQQGCTPYFGVMEGDPAAGGEFAAAVKMVNPDLGYAHLLKVTADTENLFGPEPAVEITLAAYVNDKPIQDYIPYE